MCIKPRFILLFYGLRCHCIIFFWPYLGIIGKLIHILSTARGFVNHSTNRFKVGYLPLETHLKILVKIISISIIRTVRSSERIKFSKKTNVIHEKGVCRKIRPYYLIITRFSRCVSSLLPQIMCHFNCSTSFRRPEVRKWGWEWIFTFGIPPMQLIDNI